jgi:hypothetical protein
MKIIKKGDFYHASHITGPRANLLMLAIAASGENAVQPIVQALEHPKDFGHGLLSSESVLAAVLEGVNEGNAVHGTSFSVAAVRYYINDSGPVAIYKYLARKIIDHLSARSGVDPH